MGRSIASTDVPVAATGPGVARSLDDAPAGPRPWLLVVGLALGALAKLADSSGVTWLADLGTYPSAWVLCLVLVVATAGRARAAAVDAGLVFVAACVAYYLVATLALGFGVDRWALVWIVTAVAVVPVMAWLLATALAGGTAPRSAALATAAAVAVVEGPLWQLALRITGVLPPEVPLRPVQCAVAIVTVGAILVVAGRRGRVWPTLVMLPAAAVVVGGVVDSFYSLV